MPISMLQPNTERDIEQEVAEAIQSGRFNPSTTTEDSKDGAVSVLLCFH